MVADTLNTCCENIVYLYYVVHRNIFGRPFVNVKRFALCYRYVVCLSDLSVCNVGALWSNGWMDQDETWHAGRPRSRTHCIRWGPSCPPSKGHRGPPIFGPYLLWPQGCMDQDATWYGGKPRPRRLCVRWGSPQIFGPCLLTIV